MHIPVLLDDILRSLNIAQGCSVLDCTFGRGGYSSAFLEKGANVTAIDRDETALEAANSLKALYPDRFTFILEKFSNIQDLFDARSFDIIVFDIGISSPQVDEASRGFSFNKCGPLDMRMGNVGKTAADVINTYPERQLADLFYIYGEEQASRKFAKLICQYRHTKLFETTTELAELIEKNSPKLYKKHKKIHPATKIFQALRIEVNDELEEFTKAINSCQDLLKSDGYLVTVTFHSLEDRIAKNYLKAYGQEMKQSKYAKNQQEQTNIYKILTKKPITASDIEIKRNPRSSCAKLRIAQRTGVVNKGDC